MFPDLAVGFASGGHGEDCRGFVDHRRTEEDKEEEETDFLRSSWAGPPKHPHHRPVSPDRTRSLSLENDLPVSFLIRSAALEDLTAVGDKIRETQEPPASDEFPQQGLSVDDFKSHHEGPPQTATSRQPQETTSGDGDVPSMSISHYANGTISVEPSLEYGQGCALPKQDFASVRLRQEDNMQRDSFVGPQKKEQDTECPEREAEEVSCPSKSQLGSPSTSSGSPARKSLVPVAQFKGLCCHLHPSPSAVSLVLPPPTFALQSSLAVPHCRPL
ncbi:uncharacterized protein [Salminus brasiliensis]|uniref:uncharacterized protein n=1 Tax=Salminus brasiliensis TaxID=930266 RepID=UPI003B836737